MDNLLIGIIIGSFGLDGTLKVLSKTNMQNVRYKKGNIVFLYNKNEQLVKELVVSEYRSSGQFDYVKVDEINTKEEADTLNGYSLMVNKNSDDLKEGYYFYSDLEGCEIVDKEGKAYGKVTRVEEFPAQLTLRVKGKNNKGFFVPFIPLFIKDVNIMEKKITVEIMEGML